MSGCIRPAVRLSRDTSSSGIRRLQRCASPTSGGVAFTPFGCFPWDNGGLTVYGYDANGQIQDPTPEEKRDRVEQLKRDGFRFSSAPPKAPLWCCAGCGESVDSERVLEAAKSGARIGALGRSQ
jgi:hypothetical protein